MLKDLTVAKIKIVIDSYWVSGLATMLVKNKPIMTIIVRHKKQVNPYGEYVG